jgi:hypothetical protein
MFFSQSTRSLLTLLLISSSPLPQGPPLPSSASPQRDPQAVAIFSQAATAAGGVNALTAVLDLTATAQITFYWAGEATQGTATVRCRGLNQFRLDATLPDGVHSWIATVGAALEKHPDGTITLMPFQNTLKPATATFPFIPLVAALQDPTTTISYVGLVSHDGQQAHDIRLQRNFQASSDPNGAQSAVTRTDFFIDPNTFLILSMQDMAYPKDNEPGESPREIQFSGYQSASGIVVPFSIKELIGGQQTVTIQLNQITLNSGLTDADFTL